MSRQPGNRPAAAGRATPRHVEWVHNRLSERDWAILATLDQLRVATSEQLERLHFAGLTGRSRAMVRGRVLRRLVAWRVLAPLARRIGGGRRGSSRTIYTLDATGQRLMRQQHNTQYPDSRVRRPTAPGDRFLAHSLAVSQLYVDLTTNAATAGAEVAAFAAEPASWWPDGLGGWLKPDAYALLAGSAYREHWWIEVDRATESLPTVQRQLRTYLDFYQRGQLGPSEVMPRVLVSTVSQPRREAIRALVAKLPPPAEELFRVVLDRDAGATLLGSLTA